MAVAFRTIGLEYGQDVMLKTDIGVADPPGYWQDIWTMAAGIYGDNTGYTQQQTGKHTSLHRAMSVIIACKLIFFANRHSLKLV